MEPFPHPSPAQRLIWLSLYFATLIWSAIDPKDRFTWFLEVAPALIGLVVLAVSWKRFPLTPLLYWLILAHCIILMVGSHYTYAEVPLFDWIRDQFQLQRNNYDKVGHFAQGFVPAMIARELLIRLQVVKNGRWRTLFILCFVLAFSAFYELIEWWVALASGDDAVAFLATQGDPWDTQSDMLMALIGGTMALLLLSKAHDRQLEPFLEKG
jgi:putative membrane protein